MRPVLTGVETNRMALRHLQAEKMFCVEHHTWRVAMAPAWINLVDVFQAPVRQGPAQSRALRDALYSSGVEVRYIEFEGEGHGLRNPQHRRREYELVGAFLHDVIDR